MGAEINFYGVFVTTPSFIFVFAINGRVLSISRSSPIMGFDFCCKNVLSTLNIKSFCMFVCCGGRDEML